MLDVRTFAVGAGKTSIMLNGEAETGHTLAYATATAASGLVAVTYGEAPSGTTAMTSNPMTITPTSGHTVVRVVELDASGKAVAFGDALINI